MSASGSTMTDEERQELIQRLSNELEDFVAEKSLKARENPSPVVEDDRTIDEIAEELKKHPAFLKEIDYSQPFTPEIEGLMRLKYEDSDPVAKAEAFKDDGNYEFKKKKYRIAIDNYTEGIKVRCPDKELNAILYSNRAAAQYHLSNFRSSLNDCIFARKFKPDHLKSIVKGAMCCMEMRQFADTISWCDSGLTIESKHDVLLELRSKAEKCKREQDRDRRKEEAKERKEQEKERQLLNTIVNRGIKVAGPKPSSESKSLDPLLLTSLETHNPSNAKVHVDEADTLHWPVLFLYPEYAQTDFIEAFNENDRFCDHLYTMFGPEATPTHWDKNMQYLADKLEVHFEDKEKETLHQISPTSTLLEALQQDKYEHSIHFIQLCCNYLYTVQTYVSAIFLVQKLWPVHQYKARFLVLPLSVCE